jgi:hypothetical protein
MLNTANSSKLILYVNLAVLTLSCLLCLGNCLTETETIMSFEEYASKYNKKYIEPEFSARR